jgi:MFS transporter, FSR family, fosmidomycin resistance protein
MSSGFGGPDEMTGKSLWLSSVGHSYNDMYFYLLPLLIPLFRMEFHLSYTQVGIIMSVFYLVVAVLSIAWGALSNKYGHYRLLSLGFLTAAMGLLAVTISSSLYLIVLFIAVMSMGASTFHPLATAMVSFDKRRPGFSMGIFEGSGTVGGIFATGVISLLIISLGWRWTVALLALPGLVLAYVFYKKTISMNDPPLMQTIKHPKTRRVIFLFFTGRTVRGLAAGATLSFLPSYIMEAWHLQTNTGSLIYMSFFIGGLVGAVALGYLADRLNPIGLATLSTLMPVLLIFVLTMKVILPLGVLLILLTGAFHLGFYPPHNLWIAESITQEQRSKYFGIGMGLETVAVAVAPGIFGLIADKAGIMIAFRSTTAVWLIAGILFAFVFARGHDKAEQWQK